MCRDQNLISETDGRTDGRTSGQTDEQTYERMKIEKPGVGRPLLGPAKICNQKHQASYLYQMKLPELRGLT